MKRPSTRAVLIGAIWATFGVFVFLGFVYSMLRYDTFPGESGTRYFFQQYETNILGALWESFIASVAMSLVCMGPFFLLATVVAWLLTMPRQLDAKVVAPPPVCTKK